MDKAPANYMNSYGLNCPGCKLQLHVHAHVQFKISRVSMYVMQHCMAVGLLDSVKQYVTYRESADCVKTYCSYIFSI